MFLDGYQFNNKNAHMAQKEIILYGKITFYVILFYPGRICIFSKKRTLLFTKSIFLFESQQSILLQKWKKLQYNTNINNKIQIFFFLHFPRNLVLTTIKETEHKKNNNHGNYRRRPQNYSRIFQTVIALYVKTKVLQLHYFYGPKIRNRFLNNNRISSIK